jgi:hypothetical protein
MLTSKRFVSLLSLAAMASLVPLAKADEWDKKTILTINETIQVPHATLQPGTYVFKLLNSTADRHIVQIFNKDENHLFATILAIPNYRLTPTGDSKFVFWETPAGQPPALRAWFYPGDNFGQEFAYPKNMSTQIAAATNTPVPTTEATTAEEYKSAEINTTPAPTPAPQVAEAAPAPPPPPEPTPAAAPAPEPAPQAAPEPAPQAAPEPAPAPQQLPQTASVAPLVGLIGVISLLAFAALRMKRMS